MLVDDVTITVAAGNGGKGAVSFRRSTVSSVGPPDGGNGGRGGDISVQGSANQNDLAEFRYKKSIRAGNGGDGSKWNGFGRNGEDTLIQVPFGTRITDGDTGRSFEITDAKTKMLVAKGGRGGKGNAFFKSATNRSPQNAEPGATGERKTLHLQLRLIAEIGLIGLPNAGKSSLLAALTNARPAIGDYPFTTLEPNIGMLGAVAIADIPGLIEGASRGRGLGMKFLSHIEKTKLLVHVIDGTGENLPEAYRTVRTELEAFNPSLTDKPEIIFLNKTDLMDPGAIRRKTPALRKLNRNIIAGSAREPGTLQALKRKFPKNTTR